MHQPKVEFNKKILQPKLDVQQRIKNSSKERREIESILSPVCVGTIWIEWKREKQLFIVKKRGRRRVKIKGIWRDGRIIRLRYKVVGDKKLKVGEMLEEE